MTGNYKKKYRLAAFGLRKFPPSQGAAGADVFAYNVFTRLSNKGFHITVFTKGDKFCKTEYTKNINVYTFPIVPIKGISTLIHSMMVSIYIIFSRKYDISHTQNGGNAIFSLILNFFRIPSFCSYDGLDKNRKDRGYVGKSYLSISEYFCSKLKYKLIIDNIPTKNYFEQKYKNKFTHIPFGSENNESFAEVNPLGKILKDKDYILFIGRFVKDKGIDYLIKAFQESKISINYNLVIVGGPSEKDSLYSRKIKSMDSDNVKIVGYYYGEDVNKIIKDAFYYVQPSYVEGLSPVILQVIGLKTPIIVSNIPENTEVVDDKDLTFKVGDVRSLAEKLDYIENNPMEDKQKILQENTTKRYNWNQVMLSHKDLFLGELVEK